MIVEPGAVQFSPGYGSDCVAQDVDVTPTLLIASVLVDPAIDLDGERDVRSPDDPVIQDRLKNLTLLHLA